MHVSAESAGASVAQQARGSAHSGCWPPPACPLPSIWEGAGRRVVSTSLEEGPSLHSPSVSPLRPPGPSFAHSSSLGSHCWCRSPSPGAQPHRGRNVQQGPDPRQQLSSPGIEPHLLSLLLTKPCMSCTTSPGGTCGHCRRRPTPVQSSATASLVALLLLLLWEMPMLVQKLQSGGVAPPAEVKVPARTTATQPAPGPGLSDARVQVSTPARHLPAAPAQGFGPEVRPVTTDVRRAGVPMPLPSLGLSREPGSRPSPRPGL